MITQTCELYIVRHGQTDWNIQGIIQGQKDVPLNETGISQAKELATTLTPVSFAAIYASDLSRVRRTAEIIAAGRGLDIVTNMALRERSMGEMEGQPYPQDKGHWHFGPDAETPEEVYERFRKALCEIARDHTGQTVLVVTSSGPIRQLLIRDGLIDEADGHDHPALLNGSYSVLRSDGRGFELERVGQVRGSTASTAE